MELECKYAGCDVKKKGETSHQSIELLIHIGAKHHRASEGQGGGGESIKKKMDRPKISEEATKVKWKTFLNNWKRYKSSQNVKKTEDIWNKLLNCCSEDVRESLDNARGVDTDKLDKKDLLARIKKAAVKSINKSVHRKNFHNMRQEEGEGENFDQEDATV